MKGFLMRTSSTSRFFKVSEETDRGEVNLTFSVSLLALKATVYQLKVLLLSGTLVYEIRLT